MNKKISITVFIILALLTLVSFASAYDISIDSLYPTSTNPPMVNTPGNIYIGFSNIGANDFTTSAGTITLDFGDGSSENIGPLPPLTNSSPNNIASSMRNHTYTSAGTYTITATFSGSGDTNSANNVKITTITVITPPTPTFAFNPSSESFQITQGFSETHNIQLSNTGTTSAMVKVQMDGDLISGSHTIPASNVDINVVGVSGTTFLQTTGTYKNIGLTINIDSNQETGVYSGTFEVVDANNPTTIWETMPITVTVLDNGMSTYSNHAPVISAIQTQHNNINTEFTYNVQASDADGDPIYFSLVQAPTGMHINANTGHIYGWTPTMQTTETIIVQATDLMNASVEQFDIVVDPGTGTNNLVVNPSEVLFGGSLQDREQYVTQSFTINNPGTDIVTLSSIDLLTPSGSAALPSVYDPSTVTLSNNIINPGDTITATATLYVPADFDGQEMQIGIARILGSTNSGSSISQDVDIKMQAKSYLEITDVRFEINGDDVNEDELLEGEDIKVIATIKNNYDSGSNAKINDVYFTVESNDWNVDETSNSQDLNAGHDDEFTAEFNLASLVSQTTTTLTLKAYGDDDNNNFQHVAEFTVNVEVERQDDDIRITSADFDDDTISPNTLSSQVSVKVGNFGNNDQNNVKIKVESITSGLSYSQIYTENINSGDSVSKNFNIPLPGNLNPGTYSFRVSAENDNTQADPKTITLTVISSTVVPGGNTGNSGNGNSGGSVVVNPNNGGTTTGTQGVIANPVYGQSASDLQRFTDSDAFIMLLAGLVVFAFIVIMIASMLSSSRKKKRIQEARRRAAARRRRERQAIEIK